MILVVYKITWNRCHTKNVKNIYMKITKIQWNSNPVLENSFNVSNAPHFVLTTQTLLINSFKIVKNQYGDTVLKCNNPIYLYYGLFYLVYKLFKTTFFFLSETFVSVEIWYFFNYSKKKFGKCFAT